MHRYRTYVYVVYLLLLSVSVQAVTTGIPLEAFADLPYIHSVNLSPNGKRAGIWLNKDGNSIIVSRDLDNGEVNKALSTDNVEFKINWFRWVNNERLVVSIRFADNRYHRPSLETRLISVMYDGTDTFNLVRHIRPQMNLQDDIIDWMDDDPEHVLISIMGERDSPIGPAVYRVNVYDGERDRVHRAQSGVNSWLTDQQHRVRVGIKSDSNTTEVIVRSADTNDWHTAWQFANFSTDEVWPLGFDLHPNILYVQAYHEGRKAIFRVALDDPSYKKELLLANSRYDVDGKLIYSSSGSVVGVKLSHSGIYHFWEENYQGLYRGIKKELKNTTNHFVAFSRDDQRYILLAISDTVPGTYYFGDRKHGVLQPFGYRYPKLKKGSLSPTKGVEYTARDGVRIEAFLTLPKRQQTKNLPTIIFPHGGPMEKDDGSFDYWTAFFASRGYAVLQMNFRGSTGYGLEFMKAGFENWGLSMQDDVTDGTRWLIEQGIADPDRICIVGASYGGYVAMMGLVKTPELFKCAVSFAGISDLPTFVLSRDTEVARHQIGSSFDQLRETSPLHNVSAIKAPILLVHGEKDRIVPVSQSREMKKALDENNKTFIYLELSEGDHYLSNGNNRLLMFKEMDSFLKKHLVQKVNKP